MNVNKITEYIFKNYDENVENFIHMLEEINCDLIYNGTGLEDDILNRKVYSCSVRIRPKRKILNTILPIMLGSRLDIGIRKLKINEFKSLENIPNILEYWEHEEQTFESGDIAITCFLINGILRQIPFFMTNDVSNIHIANKNIVRLYRYNIDEKGKQLSMYFDSLEGYKRGDLVLKLNNGKSFKVQEDDTNTLRELTDFFECPYKTQPKILFKEIYAQNFNIDNIGNKIVISPGYLFYKLFRKTLYLPIKEKQTCIRKKHLIVSKSIENGDLLHVISKKTVFHKEVNLKHKMVNASSQVETQREIGQNNEIFMEKKTTCYRDVNCQYYPYLVYSASCLIIQMSSKVKSKFVLSFNDSFIGYLCIYGTSETKNVGRTMMLTRNTFVSTQDDLNLVYKELRLEEGSDELYIVVNAACIEVTKSCFRNINLIDLKHRFKFIECYQNNKFIHINYKVGLLYKRLDDFLWVTSRDIHFWMNKFYGFTKIEQLVELKSYDFITSHSVDIIKYFKHNAYPRNLLTLTSLKNAILSYTPEYSLFFYETVSAYCNLTAHHKPILQPENKLSEHFTMLLPRLSLAYGSFKGSTQEDCIVMSKHVNVFDSYRFYTVKLKFENTATKYFHPTRGPQNPNESKSFLGTIVCPTDIISIISQTMHLVTNNIDKNIIEIYFTKPNFQVMKYKISESYLFICINTMHNCSTGDKLSSLHGQKGVVVIFDTLPRSKYTNIDLIINPYCLISRQTMGQIKESLDLGGRDYDRLINSDGKEIPGTTFIGPIHYFPISYLSSEHNYIAKECVRDKIIGQPVRGRSRLGGMRIGNMEHFNCLLGNGLAACFEEKSIEHSDRIMENGIPLPKAVTLCSDDAMFFKCSITYKTKPSIEVTDEKNK